MGLFKRSLGGALSGAFSVIVYLLSLRVVRNWLLKKIKGGGKTSKGKIVEAKGEVIDG